MNVESLFLLCRSLGMERRGFYEKQQPVRIFHPKKKVK
jgi:hypothetical protein